MVRIVALLLAVLLAAPPASACTCFFVHNDSVSLFARNYDWALERGVVMVNKRGVAKTAFSFDTAAEWTSKFGSVTFNQYGREFPCDGMNEAGLVVAVMWLGETVYPAIDDRPSVSSAQWVQYQLDTAATVDEVLASDKHLRIMQAGAAPVHYLVADASGAAAVVEWIDGKRVVHTGKDLPVAALTNDTYERSQAYLQKHTGFGGDLSIPRSYSSLDRFARAAAAVKQGSASTAWSAEESYQRLAGVAQGLRTKWSIVYDARNRTVRFKTLSASAVKTLDLGKLDLSTATPTQVVSISTAAPGDVAGRLTDYDTDANLREINAAFDGTFFLQAWPKALRERLAKYPDLKCRPMAAVGADE